MADTEAARALTAEELNGVKSHAEELYAALAEPTQDEEDYYGLILETVELLLEELEPTGEEVSADALEMETEGQEYTLDLFYGPIQFFDDVVTYYDSDKVQQQIPHNPKNIYTITQTNAASKSTSNTISVGQTNHYCTDSSSHRSASVEGISETISVTKDFIIILDGIKIVRTKTGARAFSVSNATGSTVAIILKDGTMNYLQSGLCRAGLEKNVSENGIDAGGTLVISCETGYKAWVNNHSKGHTDGINGGCNGSCGYLHAKAYNNSTAGVHSGAGIGSGGNINGKNGGVLENLVIAGGRIDSYGGRGGKESSGGAAAIGGGAAPNWSSTKETIAPAVNITITGGTINAVRGSCSAANIGGGYRSGFAHVTIYGGNIKADEMAENTVLDYPERAERIRAAAIGAGGGGYTSGSPAGAIVTIYDGNIIAYSQYGAAIGGGAGGSAGDASDAEIYIYGGTIVAETGIGDGNGAGAAIGAGGSLGTGYGGAAKVHIYGGEITATSENGADIGGGGTQSTTKTDNGGKGTITISGGIITAPNGGIGGGHAKAGTGGNAEVTITGGTIYAQSIGGGGSVSGNGGDAHVTIDGESANITLTGLIGGGNSDSGNGGNASVTVKNGNLLCASIGGGNSITGNGGNIVGVDNKPGIYFTGGTIQTGEIGGGTNTLGHVGYASALIEGGDIRGQFVMRKSDQGCTFTMTGGTIHGVDLTAASTTVGNTTFIHTQKNGGALYMDDTAGVTEISGGIIEGCKAENGGAVYMTGGSFTLDGTAEIRDCEATQNGGAVYLGGGHVEIQNGVIGGEDMGNIAQNGGAVYINGGDMTITGGVVSQNIATANGGAVAVLSGNFTMSGGTIGGQNGGNTATNGGAVYVSGGDVALSGGTVSHNIATVNGGGIAVNNGNIVMSGGHVDNNQAVSGSGGGMYVASSGENVAVTVYSGYIQNNTAAVSGGAVGLQGGETSKIRVQIGVNLLHKFADGKLEPIPHEPYVHTYCPVIKGNSSSASGGAFYITGGSSTTLNIYCLEESGNSAPGDKDINNVPLSDFLMVEGGTVTISTASDSSCDGQDHITGSHDNHGHAAIHGSVHVSGGRLDLFGNMDNPSFEKFITVDLTKQEDYFHDHRSNEQHVKLSYYENFDYNGVVDSTRTAIDMDVGEAHTISDSLYKHEGYNIYGWNTDPNATPTTTTGWYDSGKTYVFVNTEEQKNQFTLKEGEQFQVGDLILYAIWEPNGYSVRFDPNVPEGEAYTGTQMADQVFTYNVAQTLTPNTYSREGYLFTGWSYVDDQGETKTLTDGQSVTNLTAVRGGIVVLKAIWESCVHPDASITYTTAQETSRKAVLTKTCTLCGYAATVTLTAEDAEYDGQAHPAKVVCSDESWFPMGTISYTGTKIGKTEPVDAPETATNAGDYTAAIEAGGCHGAGYLSDRKGRPACTCTEAYLHGTP